MSLGITVGRLARWLRDGDEEVVGLVRREMAEVNRVLLANRLPAHAEPESLPPLQRRNRLDHMPYSWYDRLRRAVAFSRQAPGEFTAAGENEDVSRHPYGRAEVRCRRSHLISQGVEGYYVPVDFRDPLFDTEKKLVGRALGSCQAAIRELVAVAPLLRIRLTRGRLSKATADKINGEEEGPFYEERQAWLILFESFRLSIKHKASVCFHRPSLWHVQEAVPQRGADGVESFPPSPRPTHGSRARHGRYEPLDDGGGQLRGGDGTGRRFPLGPRQLFQLLPRLTPQRDGQLFALAFRDPGHRARQLFQPQRPVRVGYL
jgi:hypothetical protein